MFHPKPLVLKTLGVLAFVVSFLTPAFADIPAPKTPEGSNAAHGLDWAFVAGGLFSAFAGALIFVWLGRKLLKRS
jgi:hypothetical protein